MASIATAKGGARRPGTKVDTIERRTGPRIDNDRTETMGRFWLVVMMPVVIAALVGLIMFYLTLPLR